MPAATAPAAFVANVGSTIFLPSVALMIAKSTPSAAADDQFTGADPYGGC